MTVRRDRREVPSSALRSSGLFSFAPFWNPQGSLSWFWWHPSLRRSKTQRLKIIKSRHLQLTHQLQIVWLSGVDLMPKGRFWLFFSPLQKLKTLRLPEVQWQRGTIKNKLGERRRQRKWGRNLATKTDVTENSTLWSLQAWSLHMAVRLPHWTVLGF